jgi:hypothetical protein
MDYPQSEIRREIESTRAGMAEKITALEERVDGAVDEMKRLLDPKYQTERHPWLMMGISVALGYLSSRLIFPLRGNNIDHSDGTRRSAVRAQQSPGFVGGLVSAVLMAVARDVATNFFTKRSAQMRNPEHSAQGTWPGRLH